MSLRPMGVNSHRSGRAAPFSKHGRPAGPCSACCNPALPCPALLGNLPLDTHPNQIQVPMDGVPAAALPAFLRRHPGTPPSRAHRGACEACLGCGDQRGRRRQLRQAERAHAHLRACRLGRLSPSGKRPFPPTTPPPSSPFITPCHPSGSPGSPAAVPGRPAVPQLGLGGCRVRRRELGCCRCPSSLSEARVRPGCRWLQSLADTHVAPFPCH